MFLVGDYPGNDYFITTKFSNWPFFQGNLSSALRYHRSAKHTNVICNVSAKIQTLKTRAAFLVTNQILVIY